MLSLGCGAGREPVEIDADRNPEDALRSYTRLEDEVAHLCVSDLDAVDSSGVSAQRSVGLVELGISRRPGLTVEVREPEPVGRLQPAWAKRAEVIRMEDGLPACKGRPRRWSDLVAQPARPGAQPRRVVVDRPADLVTDDEQPRSLGPPGRPHRDVSAEERSRRTRDNRPMPADRVTPAELRDSDR